MDIQPAQQSAPQVAFVFSNVANYQELAAAFRPGVEVHILDAGQDGLAQMAAILQGRSGIEALHVIGHGAQGSLEMGNVTLDSANIGAYGDVLGQIGSALVPGGDILLYGCDVGANAAGAQFVGQIAQLTGADVAASTDATGGAQLGGDWTLEYRTGLVTADGAFDAATVRNLDTLLLQTTEDVNPGMTTGTGHFVPGFTLSTTQIVGDDSGHGVNGGIFFDEPDTTVKTETFTITADGTSVGSFDLKGMTFLKPFDTVPQFTITITGHRVDGSTPVAILKSASGASNFAVFDDFTDMTGLVSFDVVMQQTPSITGAYPGDLTFDSFLVDNLNKAPTFVDTVTALNTTENTAVSVLPLLHVSDTDSGQTETWTQQTAPAHGTLSISGATASSGGSNVTPGGTFTYTPTSGFAGTDTFVVRVSDGALTATRTVSVNVAPSAPGAPDLTSGSDSGTNTSDNITKLPTVSFSGTAAVPDGSTVTLFIDKNNNGVFDAGTDISGTGSVSGSSWSVSALDISGLSDGSYNTYAKITTGGVTGAFGAAGSFTVDRTAPTVTITSDKATLHANQTATITFTFSDDPGSTFSWDGSSGDVTVNGGTLSAIAGTGLIRTAVFTPNANTDNGTASITVNASSYIDPAGNNGTAGTTPSITFDTKAPTLTISSDVPALHGGQTATITFTFSEDPGASFTSGDIVVSGGTLGALSGTGATRTAVFTPTANTDNGTASITVAGTTYSDAASNTGTDGTTPSLIFDTKAPTVAITSDKAAMGPGDTATITFTFSEDPGASFNWDGTSGDVTVNGGTLSAIAGTGTVRTAVLTAGAGSTASVTVTANSYTDGAGNTGAGATSPTISLDTAPPVAPSTPVLDTGFDSGTSSTDHLIKSTTPVLTGTAEAGSTVKLYDGATEIGSGTADGAGAWTITTSTLGGGLHSITAQATDAAGNTGLASGVLAITVDATRPTLTITSDAAALTIGETATITFTFSEDPGSTFVSGDITVSGGTLGALSGTGNQRTAVFTPTAGTNGGAASISVDAGNYTDAAGNDGFAGTTPSISFDTKAPTVIITSDVAALKVGETATITFTFSEDPGTSFGWDGSVGSVAVSGGTLSATSGTGLTRTAVFTPDANTNNGTASITVTHDSYSDAAGNTGAAGATPSLVFDTLAPDAPATPSLALGSDSGTAGDNYTNVATPTLSGTAEAGATVKLYDGATQIASKTADGAGNWSVPVSTLSDGDHAIRAVAIDAAGNTSTASGELDFTIDTTPPTLAITSDKAALTISQTATVTFTFSEDPGTTFNSSSVTVSGGTLGTISGTGLTRTAVFTPAANTDNGTASITVGSGKYTDAAGNDGSAGTTPGIHFDTLAPSVTITSDASVLKIGETATITFTFSEDPGATFGLVDTVTTGGTLASLSGSGLTRTAIFTPTATSSGPASITVTHDSYSDAAGNTGAAGTTPSLTFDTLAPTVSLSSDTSALKAGETATITFTFSEDPGADFTVGSVTVSGGTLTGMSGTGGTRTATFNPDADANGTASITVDSANYHDAAGNTGDNSSSLNIAFDTSVPSLLITSDTSALKIGEIATISFIFSEDPGTSFSWDGTAGDIHVQGGTLSALSGTGILRTAIFTPDGSTNGGTATITVDAGSYADAAGNGGPAGTTPSLTFDTLAPGAPSAPALLAASDSGTSHSDNLTNVATPTLAGTSEAGATVKLYDGATLVGTGTADGTGNWSIATNTLAEGAHSITAIATDAAGNTGTASGALGITIDHTQPTLVITSDKAALNASETATITFTFSEDPGSTFTSGSLLVSGGALGAISGTGLTRTAVFTPSSDTNAGTASITAAGGTYTDAAGNSGAVATSPSIHFDTLLPTVTISSDTPALKIGETATITFLFSEDPGATFTPASLTVEGGALSAISGTGLTRTAIFTPDANTNGGTASITVGDGTYSDAAGNGGHAGATPSLVFDTLAPGAPSALALVTDSGTSQSDNLTNIATPTLAGTAEAGATVHLYDGATLVGTGTAGVGGNWSIDTSTLAEGGHTIVATATDAAGNTGAASGPLTVTVDHTQPTLVITSDKPALHAGQTATITFTFSEDPGNTFSWDGSNGSVSVSGGTLSAISGTGLTRTAVFTPVADTSAGTASITVGAAAYTDAAGNDGAAGTTPGIVFDTLVPTVTITSDKPALKIGETATITFTFSEDPGASFSWDGTSGSVTVSHGTLSAISGTGTTRTAVFTPDANTDGGTASITIADGKYTDAAGNDGHAAGTPSLVFDTLAPGAPAQPVLQSDTGASATDGLTNATSLIFAGTTEANATVTLIDDTTRAVLGTAVAAADGKWGITVNGLAEGAVNVAAFVTDAAGNIGTQSTATAVTIDRTAPGAPSLVLAGSNSGTVNVQGLDAGASWQYSLDGGAHWQNGSGSSFQVHTDGSYSALAHQVDPAGNIGTASAPLAFTVDTTGPASTVALSDTSLTTGETAKVTFTFSESVVGFDLADITASNGTMSGLASSDGGRTWTATFTPALGVTADTNKITVNNAGVFDTAGNAGTGSSSSDNYSVITSGVGATIKMSDTDLRAGETALVSIVFTDAVTGFALSDLSAASGKLSDLRSSDGSRWTALFTPSTNTSDATNVITLDNSGVIGSHGTRGTGTSSSDNYAVSTIRPTGSVSVADHLLAPGATTTVTIKFSEAVSGFDASDLTVSHGTLSGLASSDGGRTWTASLTGDSGGKSATPGSVSLNMGGVHNGADNTGLGNVSAQFVITSANSKSAAVDGVPVITDTITDPNSGHQDQLIAIPEVKPGRVDDSSTANHTLADIPLVASATPGSAPVLTASLPTGAGMLVQGPAAPMSTSDGLTDLIQRINSKTDAGSSSQSDMAGHGQDFIASLGAGTTIESRTITPTVAPGASLDQPIVISGANPGQSGAGAPVVGLVIDGTGLPAGSTLQLDNVDFAAVTGDVRLFGGLGRNMVVGDSGSQTIYLGPDDDVLSGGAGNDNIGSAGGNDILDGGDGNDLVAGGIGNDTLYGGNGDDLVQGGRSTVGDWTFFLSSSGAVSARHGQAVFTLGGTETVQGSELDATQPELGFLKADAQKVEGIALLYAALDRAPDVAGLSYWAASGASLADVAKGVLASSEFGGGPLGQTDNASFVRGMYEHVLGREPAAADLSYWTARLSGSDGKPAAERADVLLLVALSDEHKAHALGADGFTIGQASLKQEAGWFAGSGDDRLVGGAGNDLLVGGDGNDTVVYDGKQAQYHFTIGRDNALHVVDTVNGDVDTIVAVESAEFKDSTFDISFLKADPALLDRVGLLYQAVLDRAADVAGLKWFLSSGMDVAHLASAFVGSSEFQSHYGGMNDAAFVQALYANSGLDTKAAGGEQSWEAYLASHTRAELIAAWITQDDVVHAQFGSSGLWIV
jgi:hypothetical protein